MEALLVLTELGEEVEIENGKSFNQILSIIGRNEEILEVKRITLSSSALRRIDLFGIPFLMFVKNGNFYFRPEYRYNKAYQKMKDKIKMIEGFVEIPLHENVSSIVIMEKSPYLVRVLIRR